MDNKLEIQRATEEKHSKRFIDSKIREELLEDPEFKAVLTVGEMAIQQHIDNPNHHQSVKDRLSLFSIKPSDAVLAVFIVLFKQCQPVITLANAVGIVVTRLGLNKESWGFTTASEILAALEQCGVYEIHTGSAGEQVMLEMYFGLSPQTTKYIQDTMYLPPSLIEPDKLTNAFDWDSLTSKSSMVLGQDNHCEHLALDSLNKFNNVKLTLNKSLLTQLNEPVPEFTNKEHHDEWHRFTRQSYDVYKYIIQEGNEFYLYNKYDKRGRTYSQGYHINTQGTSFKKAMIEFADKEIIQLEESL